MYVILNIIHILTLKQRYERVFYESAKSMLKPIGSRGIVSENRGGIFDGRNSPRGAGR